MNFDLYCKFLQTLQDGEEVIWEKDKIYKVDYEDEENLYFENKTAISKKDKDVYYSLIFRDKE